MAGVLKKSVAVALAVGSMGFASQANALFADNSDPNYLGLIVDGIPPSSFITFVNNLLTVPLNTSETIGSETYFRSTNNCPGPAGPACTAVTDGVKTDLNSDPTGPTFTIDVTGYEYLWGKYDAANAGAYVWYVGNLSGNQTIPSNLGSCGETGCGLSNYALMNTDGTTPPTQIPEPISLALLGLGLASLGLIRRRKR